jgi:hypothetical protein
VAELFLPFGLGLRTNSLKVVDLIEYELIVVQFRLAGKQSKGERQAYPVSIGAVIDQRALDRAYLILVETHFDQFAHIIFLLNVWNGTTITPQDRAICGP